MNFELEKEFLGIGLLNPNILRDVVISEECFLDDKNRFIFKMMMKQFREYKTVDMQGMISNYSSLFTGKYDPSNMLLLMTECIDLAVSDTKFNYLQKTLFKRYINQMLLKQINLFYNNKISQNEMLENIHRYEAMNIETKTNKKTGEEIFDMITSENENINFRFKKLSEAANIQEKDLAIIAARPSIGKTAFILNLLEDLSNKYNCILFNLEMSEKQVYSRLVSINTKIDIKYQTKSKTEYQLNAIKQGCYNIASKEHYVYSSSQTINSMKQTIINQAKKGHTLVFIDYVGLIGDNEKNKTLYELVTRNVKELRQVTLDYDCTIFLVAQLNREIEKKKKRLPRLSDLKESGELEQAGTTILMLHDENSENNGSKDEIEMDVIVAKNRNGKKVITKLNYNRLNQRFDEIENIKDPNHWRKE